VKKNAATLSKQFYNIIEKIIETENNRYPNTYTWYIYMTAHFPALVQALH